MHTINTWYIHSDIVCVLVLVECQYRRAKEGKAEKESGAVLPVAPSVLSGFRSRNRRLCFSRVANAWLRNFVIAELVFRGEISDVVQNKKNTQAETSRE